MEFILGLLQAEGISIVLIIVLAFIWRDINRLLKMTDEFNSKLFNPDGMPVYQNLKECDEQKSSCRTDIGLLYTKLNTLANDITRIETRVETLHSEVKGKGH